MSRVSGLSCGMSSMFDMHNFRYLGSPEYREAFEASHSVVLALFASVSRLKERDDRSRLSAIRLMVPFYTSSLITVCPKKMAEASLMFYSVRRKGS